MLLSSLGTSIANVALPTLAQAFVASFQEIQWIVLAYLLAITTLIVSIGHSEELDYDNWGTQEFFELVRQKHKRSFVQHFHEEMLKDLIRFADTASYERLKASCERALAGLSTERIPLPKPIPEYIDSWRTRANTQDVDLAAIVDKILGN